MELGRKLFGRVVENVGKVVKNRKSKGPISARDYLADNPQSTARNFDVKAHLRETAEATRLELLNFDPQNPALMSERVKRRVALENIDNR
jgi:hypothetical protein